MTQIERGLLDTSMFIANESGRPLNAEQMPAELATSVVTVAELSLGVLAATDDETRARRMATARTVADMEILEIDEDVAHTWARLRMHLAGSGQRIRINDLWIAAVAARHGLPVVTQDADFDALAGAAGVSVIQV